MYMCTNVHLDNWLGDLQTVIAWKLRQVEDRIQ